MKILPSVVAAACSTLLFGFEFCCYNADLSLAFLVPSSARQTVPLSSLFSQAVINLQETNDAILPSSSSSNSRISNSNTPQDEYDVIVIGSGIGGLSCAAMLALYGYSVAVLESHTQPGGAAHGFQIYDKELQDVFHFDTGPSFFSGLNHDIPAKASNPLRSVLDALDEQVECIPYRTFGLKFPQGDFLHTADFGRPGGALEQATATSAAAGGGASASSPQEALQQWESLIKKMEPLAAAVAALPTAALRTDVGVALTTAPFLPKFATTNPLENLKLTAPYSNILQESGVQDAFLKNWLDLLCFCLSGLPASGTITAEMAMMMGEFYDQDAVMDCPKHGAQSIVQALVRGLKKHSGSLFLKSHVDRINIENGKAIGVTLRKNQQKIKAKKAVVSNLSVWDLFSSGILDTRAFPHTFVKERMETPVGKSFMHMHVGFRMTRNEIEKLQAHYMYMDDWERGVEAEDNAVLLSIPSVHDESLAPPGYGVLHIYTPATEDYERWKGLDRKSDEYKQLKEERSQYLWKVLEKVIPDIRDRAKVVQVGTPLTHERFLRRYKGSYGAAIQAGKQSFPFPRTPVKGLLVCGDSCFPGIGVPAVAGSGLLAANSVSLDSLKPQLDVLRRMNVS